MTKLTAGFSTSRWRFLEALLVVIAALLAQSIFRDLIGGKTFLLLYPAVLYSGLRGGFRPGLLATSIAVMSATYLFDEPLYSFKLGHPLGELFSIACFSATGIFSSILGQRLLDTRVAELRLQNELTFAKNEAEAANLAKSQFLANMSHEIRSPLGAITGYVDLALEQPITPEVNLQLSAVKRNAIQLSKILGEILDISEVEAGKLEIETSDFSPVAETRDIISTLESKAKEKNIQIHFTTSAFMPESIRTDRARFRQIVFSLIENAIKFTNIGEVNVNIQLKSEAKAGIPIELEITIDDTGPGLTSEQQQKLFHPFTQIDSSLTRRFGGTGLGLALAQSIAYALGGDVRLQRSEPDKGSSFIFKIHGGPFQFPKGLAVPQDHEIKASLAGMKILLAEDSPDNQFLVSLYLKSAGILVDVANNGLEAVEKAGQNSYDLILMDLQMPIMDGHQATERLRSTGFKKPIVAITAHALRSERERALKGGFDEYLTKPLQRRTLFDALARFRKTPEVITSSSEY